MYITEIFLLVKQIKIKYIWAFTSVMMLYIFLFEKRYFEIRSHWKVVCDFHGFKDCIYKLRPNHVQNSLSVHSSVFNDLYIVDPFHKTNSTVLSTPNIYFIKHNLSDICDYDYSINEYVVHLYTLSNNGILTAFQNDSLIFQINLKDLKLSNMNSFQTIDLISQENVVIICGKIGSSELVTENNEHFIAVNATNGEFIWHILDSKDDSEKKELPLKKDSDSLIHNHWKFRLINMHNNLDHLHKKSSFINFKQFLPFSYSGHVTKLIKAEKSLNFEKDFPLPLSTNKQIKNYNSLYILNKAGIFLLDIHTGSKLGRLKIDIDPHSTYTLWQSMEDDILLDLVQIKFVSKLDTHNNHHIDLHHDAAVDNSANDGRTGDIYQNKIHCNLVFTKLYWSNDQSSVFMPQISTWSVPNLCDPVNFWDYPRFDDNSWLEDKNKSVAPIVIQNWANPSGFWGRLYHVASERFAPKNPKNVICMSSDGLLTSYSSHGHINWRTSAQVGWLHISRMVKGPFHDATSVQIYKDHFYPSISIINLYFYNDTIKAVLTVGFDSLSIVDASDGQLLATHSLPCTPSHKPIIFQTPYDSLFKLHGDQIVVIKCDNMIIGFSINHNIPWLYYISIAGIVFLAILFLVWLLDPKNPYFGELWLDNQ